MDIHTVYAVVALKVRAETEADAVSKIKSANPLSFTGVGEVEAAKSILVKGIPVDHNASGISRMLEMAGAAVDILGRR